MRATVIFSQLSLLNRLCHRLNSSISFGSVTCPVKDEPDDRFPYSDVPNPSRIKSERKPYVTPMKVLIARAKAEREARKAQPCRVLEDPPDNGLLVPELVEVAHRVYRARGYLLSGLGQLVRVIPVLRCEYALPIL
ncbi:hypothetical protein KIW84_021773 [Lathyrus oleraceus]|uniref:APO domain-containing protein n=1 Tax=Pisum sativum TaxID=3888 RepID=A0A9D5BAB6_PEA|nr:hypothetical protein KIW84_021773 [Pisum sativum]